MTQLTKKTLGWMERRLSRRGFLAGAGKIALAFGLAMGGASSLALTARAACCANPPCGGGGGGCPALPPPVSNGCPAGCSQVSIGTCCDTDSLIDICVTCTCYVAGQPLTCDCEYNTAGPC